MLLTEVIQESSFCVTQIIFAEDDFLKRRFFVRFREIIQVSQHLISIAVSISEGQVFVNQAENLFVGCLFNVVEQVVEICRAA